MLILHRETKKVAKVNNDSILEVRDLTVAFGGRRVVEGLSYRLGRGRTLGIVGESGSGKSVSSLALMGLLPPGATVESGEAFMDGRDLLRLGEPERQALRGRRMSMIFQEPMTALNPVHRCGRQVMEMGVGRERVLELFAEVMLPRPDKIFRSYPHELSGGQRQRVMIAMALACEPDVIIADEPTTALDVTVQKTILDLLRDLQRRHGTSVIFITHDLGVIAQVTDDVLVMYRGRTVEQGPADRVLHQPREPYTRGLLACRPPLDSRPLRLPTVEDFLADLASQGNQNNQSNQNNQNNQTNQTPPTSPSPLLSARGLTVTFALKKSLLGRPLQTLNAVDGVSLDIREGETLGLVGESGCGKSTLGRALLGLVRPSAGEVAFRGRRIDNLTPAQMRPLRPKLQLIFQDPYSSLNPRLTIGQAIEEPLRVHAVDIPSSPAEVVADLMQQVGLDPAWRNRYPHQLSGGQRQRVCIARALVMQPEFVICDESVSALDVSVQAQVLNLLNDLKQRHHYTYLFITHDLSVVHYMADRIVVMQRGRVVETGTPDDLFRNPQTDYTRTLLDAIPRL